MIPSILLTLLLSAPASAGPAITFAGVCPTPAQMDPYIMMCGQNAYVAFQARHCADAVVASWNSTADRLMPVLQSRGKVGKQHQTEGDSQQNYWDTVVALDQQIRQMQKYTALIAEYPSVMIDVGGSTGDDDSLSCFNEAFHQVQDIVTYLDDEIIRAKKIKRSAQALMNLAAGRQQGLSTSLTAGETASGAAAPTPVPNGRNSRSASTITGEIHKQLAFSRQASKKLDRMLPKKEAAPPFTPRAGKDGELDGIIANFTNSGTLERDGTFQPDRPRAASAVTGLPGEVIRRDSGSERKTGREVANPPSKKTGLPSNSEGSSRALASIAAGSYADLDVEHCTAEETENSAPGARTFRVTMRLRNNSPNVVQADGRGVVVGYLQEPGCGHSGASLVPIGGAIPPGGHISSNGSLVLREPDASKGGGYVIFVSSDAAAAARCGSAAGGSRFRACKAKWK